MNNFLRTVYKLALFSCYWQFNFLIMRVLLSLYSFKMKNCIFPSIFALQFKWASSWDYGTYHIGDQRRLGQACAPTQSRQSLCCSHTFGSRQSVQPKIRHLAPLDGCPCAFEEWVYRRRKVPYLMAQMEMAGLFFFFFCPKLSLEPTDSKL